MSPNLQSSFWERMGLDPGHREVCLHAVQEIYPGRVVEEFKEQGYCSFTLLVSPENDTSPLNDGPPDSIVDDAKSHIVQIRPEQHSLDLGIMHAAAETYGSFAPGIRSIACNLPGSLQAFEMERMGGTPLSRYQTPSSILETETGTEAWEQRINLVQSLATFLARAWPSPSRKARADSPMASSSPSPFPGPVGTNIIPKLTALAHHLPSADLRARASKTLDRFLHLHTAGYPTAVTHGDLIPSNILIHPSTWHITGIVDWAEAEYLPFGTCLYGLEFLLGEVEYAPPSLSPGWRYHEHASRLRDIFWRQVWADAPGVKARMGDVQVVRDLGVLLWFGFAWDEGRIDRVVEGGVDDVEVVCLRAFLGEGI